MQSEREQTLVRSITIYTNKTDYITLLTSALG